MPKILTRNALIMCPHSGIGQSLPTQVAVTIAGSPVLVDGDTGTIPNCINLPPAGVPCASYILRSMHLNAVTVGGRQVMLETDFVQSITGYPLTMTEFHQVNDQSQPVTIPPGGSVATPSELQDVDRPTVTAAPPGLGFSKTTFSNSGTPPFLAVTFTLVSQFPNEWMLTLIIPPGSSDITMAAPPGVSVAPAGGNWDASPLVVTVTLTGLYMMSLPVLPAKVSLVMVGINRRGRSAYAEAVLGVSP